ncbi:IS110 family transposase, partial [Hoeflea marina]
MAGIDVSKAWLDVAVSDSDRVDRFANDAAGCAALSERLGNAELVALEATGGYEMRMVRSLLAVGVPVAVINPRQVRHFALASGRLAKTDRLDAHVILHFARVFRPAPMPDLGERHASLTALVARRRQLIDMAVAEKNRLEHAPQALVPLINQVQALLKAQLTTVDAAIATTIDQQPDLAARRDILLSVPGIGDVAAAVIIAELPELGAIDDKKLSALVGVAPIVRDSGTLCGQRHIGGGRPTVRCALYMATLSAIRCNAPIKAFYTRLRDAGRPPKVAIVAAMRKLITMINTIVKRQVFWENQKHGC